MLAAGGAAVVQPDVPPDQLEVGTTLVPTEGADGLVLETKELAPGTMLLTIAFREAQSGPDNAPVLLHAPWLRFQAPGDVPDDGLQLVLAQVTVGEHGAVVAVDATRRRLAGMPVGRVELRRPVSTGGVPLSVDQVTRAALAVTSDGGIGLTGAVDGHEVPLFGVDSALTSLALLPEGGSVGIGMGTPPRTSLHVEGSPVHSGGPGGGLSFADRSVRAFVESPDDGQRWIWYAESGVARLWSGHDVVEARSSTPGESSLRVLGTLSVTGAGDFSGGMSLGSELVTNSRDVLLRGRGDFSTGLGWYGGGKPFEGATIDGPVLFGATGGALGTTARGQRRVLEWHRDDVACRVPLTAMAGMTLADTALRLRADQNHGLGWHGAGRPFAGLTLDGPALYGFGGGALGTTSGGQQVVITWTSQGSASVHGSLSVLGTLDLRAPADVRLTADDWHGLGYYGASYRDREGKPLTKKFGEEGRAVDGPVLYGYAGGALGVRRDKTLALEWRGEEVVSRKSLRADAGLAVTGDLSISGGALRLGIVNPEGQMLAFGNNDAPSGLSDFRFWIRHNLGVQGWISAQSYRTYSDVQLKTSLEPLVDVLDLLQAVRGQSFRLRAEDGTARGPRQLGVIAQDVSRAFPELVRPLGPNQWLTVDYGGLTAVLVEAVKELSIRLAALEQGRATRI
ncbi:MAG: tail fiber domain-containing protein [Kineosporiaceae bacterium]|nr:tail fiber domain-containing protein [Kineosporiaceae bacterium]